MESVELSPRSEVESDMEVHSKHTESRIPSKSKMMISKKKAAVTIHKKETKKSSKALQEEVQHHDDTADDSEPLLVASKSEVEYTTAEVSQHNMQNDCWIIIHGKVYDVTEFLSNHPGQ